MNAANIQMNTAWLEGVANFCSIIIILMSLIFLLRLALRKAYTGYLSVFVWLFFLSTGAFALINTAWLPGNAQILLKAQNASFGVAGFSFLAITIFSVLKDATLKKRKTLARLPLIGLLLGWYLDFEKMAMVIAALEATNFFLAAKHKETHRFLWRAQVKAFLPIPLLAMYSTPAGPWFLGYLLWSFFFKSATANAAIVKEKTLVYDEANFKG